MQGFTPELLKGEWTTIYTPVQKNTLVATIWGRTSEGFRFNFTVPEANSCTCLNKITLNLNPRRLICLCPALPEWQVALTCLFHSDRDGIGRPYAHHIRWDPHHSKGPQHPQHRQAQLCCLGAFCQENCSCSIADLAGIPCWKRPINMLFVLVKAGKPEEQHKGDSWADLL